MTRIHKKASKSVVKYVKQTESSIFKYLNEPSVALEYINKRDDMKYLCMKYYSINRYLSNNITIN